MATEGQEPLVEDVGAYVLPDPLNHECARCGRPAWFRLRSAVWAGEFFLGSGHHPDHHPMLAAVYQCSGCSKATLFEFQVFSVGGGSVASLLSAYPTAVAKAWEELPDELRADHAEARSCYLAGQHRAATLVARGVLQRAVRLMTKVRGSLKQELDALSSDGTITKQLRLTADEVRLTGNDAAHPEELRAVSESEAADSLAFLDDFLQTTVVLPQRQKARAEKRANGTQ